MKRLESAGDRLKFLVIVPVVTFVADILENAGIIAMIKNYPEHLVSLATFTSFCSSVKWTFAGLTLLVIIGLLIHRKIE